MKNKYPLSRKVDIVIQELKNETLVYDLKANKAFCLNPTSALVWGMCDGKKSLSEMSLELSKKLKLPANEELIWLALEQLKKENLLESEYTVPVEYEGMTRREAVRKVGLATLIAIPVVMSLQSPIAAQASSVCGATADGTCHCQASNDCQTRPDSAMAMDQTPCISTARLSGEASNDGGDGGRPIIACNPGNNRPSCLCRGPFTCVFTGSTGNRHRRGRCG